MPRISSKFDRMDPRREAWTMRISFYTLISKVYLAGQSVVAYFDKSNAVQKMDVSKSVTQTAFEYKLQVKCIETRAMKGPRGLLLLSL